MCISSKVVCVVMSSCHERRELVFHYDSHTIVLQDVVVVWVSLSGQEIRS